jgi:hypothetical protein
VFHKLKTKDVKKKWRDKVNQIYIDNLFDETKVENDQYFIVAIFLKVNHQKKLYFGSYFQEVE